MHLICKLINLIVNLEDCTKKLTIILNSHGITDNIWKQHFPAHFLRPVLPNTKTRQSTKKKTIDQWLSWIKMQNPQQNTQFSNG